MTVRHDDLRVDWLGYATLRLEAPDGPVVYVDPGRYGVLTGEWTPDTPGVGHPDPTDYDARDGDVVVVTHDHHYDSDGVERVASEDATLVVYEGVDAGRIDRDVVPPEDLGYEVVRVGEEDQVAVGDVALFTVPAYNDPDGPHTRADGTPFHPEGFGVGVVCSIAGTRVFWPGDSDVLDGHEELDVSLFCPSISGAFTMDRHEAADLATALEPDLVLPIHYNTFDALEADSRAFAADVAAAGVPVVLDER